MFMQTKCVCSFNRKCQLELKQLVVSQLTIKLIFVCDSGNDVRWFVQDVNLTNHLMVLLQCANDKRKVLVIDLLSSPVCCNLDFESEKVSNCDCCHHPHHVLSLSRGHHWDGIVEVNRSH